MEGKVEQSRGQLVSELRSDRFFREQLTNNVDL